MKLIEKANESYYNESDPILSDHEFNLLSDDGLEIKNFRNKVKHFQPMGSLKKIKTEEDFINWRSGEIKVTPKLDGNSLEIVIVNGKVSQAITRGDGFIGNDITDKARHCNLKHNIIKDLNKYSIKCEAIMKKEYQKDYDKNLRNVVAGILNRKTPKINELKKIDIIPFDDLDFIQSKELTYKQMTMAFENKKEIYPYEIDGLVVELINKIHKEKDELLPSNIIALKFNKEGVDAEIGDIKWHLGKHAKLTPVIVLKEPVEIDGTNVQKVSASNWALLHEAGLGIGAKIQVIKSGDIIPFISKVVEKSYDIIYPDCPVCGRPGEENESGIQMLCTNQYCKGKELVYLKHIFRTFDLDFISDLTIKRIYDAGFTTIEDFFNLTELDIISLDGFGKRKAQNIIQQLKNISLTEAQVLKCAMVQGISESNGQRIIDYFGNIENFIYQKFGSNIDYSEIDGFAIKTDEIIKQNFNRFVEIYEILKDKINIKKIEKLQINTEYKPNIIFTGKCDRFKRKELTHVLEENNFCVQKSINNSTDILIVADINSNSSKMKKAKKYEITIKTYEEFFKENGI